MLLSFSWKFSISAAVFNVEHQTSLKRKQRDEPRTVQVNQELVDTIVIQLLQSILDVLGDVLIFI